MIAASRMLVPAVPRRRPTKRSLDQPSPPGRPASLSRRGSRSVRHRFIGGVARC